MTIQVSTRVTCSSMYSSSAVASSSPIVARMVRTGTGLRSAVSGVAVTPRPVPPGVSAHARLIRATWSHSTRPGVHVRDGDARAVRRQPGFGQLYLTGDGSAPEHAAAHRGPAQPHRRPGFGGLPQP